jgi:hypothetical protein
VSDRQIFIDKELSEKRKLELFGDTMLSLIDKADNIQKPELYGRIFKLHIFGECTYSDAIRICTMIEKTFYDDLRYLLNFVNGRQIEDFIAGELYKNGFLDYGGIDGGTFGGGLTSKGGLMYNINKYGMLVAKAINS